LSELGFLKVLGWWGGFLFVLIALFLRLFWGINKDEGRGRWVAWLRHDTFARRFREILNAGLDRIDRLLSPDFPDVATDRAANRKTEPARAWSLPLLDLCLLLAVVYPIGATFAAWTVRGAEVSVGGQMILPNGIDGWRRWLGAASLVLATVLYIAGRSEPVTRRRVAQHSIAALVAGVAWYFVGGGAALAVGIGLGLALGGARGVALQGIHACALAAAVVIWVAFSHAGQLIAAPIFVASSVIALFLSNLQSWSGDYFNRRALNLLLFTGIIFISLYFLVRFQSELAFRDINFPPANPAAIALFLGFLPLLNAWADFASVGLTRWRLRIGVQHNLVANAVLDGLAGLLILIALAFAVVATMDLVRTSDGVPLYDAGALLADLRDRPGAYWWLGFMLFSTLLPTLTHLSIGTFPLFTLASGWLGKPIAAGLMKGDSPEGRFASLALTLAAALAVWLPCLLLWLALSNGGGILLEGLLRSCEWFLGVLDTYFPHTERAQFNEG
jgi:hypothetical protein